MVIHTPETINNPPLTYAEFTTWKPMSKTSTLIFPAYNNFYTLFLDTKANHVARNKPLYKKFRAENPELDQKVTSAITSEYVAGGQYPDIVKILHNVEPLLYEAYCVMHSWVSEDEELFA
jgi:hypothetical protein